MANQPCHMAETVEGCNSVGGEPILFKKKSIGQVLVMKPRGRHRNADIHPIVDYV
jgi:hypothetical protein